MFTKLNAIQSSRPMLLSLLKSLGYVYAAPTSSLHIYLFIMKVVHKVHKAPTLHNTK